MSVIQERRLDIPSFIVATPNNLSPELSGNPEYNFLLHEPIFVCDEAHAIVQQEALSPLLAPFVQININGGVMGQQAEADGWGNIKGHLLTTQRFVEAGGKIIRLPQHELLRTQAAALIHDSDTRIHKQLAPRREIMANGVLTLVVDQDALFEMEMDDSGPSDVEGLECVDSEILAIAGVTHAKWEDPELWDPQKKLLRLADSCVGSTRCEAGGYTVDTVTEPEQRIQDLKKHKPRFDELGFGVYGKPTFDRLSEINHMSENDLRRLAEQRNPVLLWCYFFDNPNNRFVHLIRDVMTEKVKL